MLLICTVDMVLPVLYGLGLHAQLEENIIKNPSLSVGLNFEFVMMISLLHTLAVHLHIPMISLSHFPYIKDLTWEDHFGYIP